MTGFYLMAEREGLCRSIPGRHATRQLTLSKFVPDKFVEPIFLFLGFSSLSQSIIQIKIPPQKTGQGFYSMAEREGFEPSVPVKGRLISNQVHSTALPPLLILGVTLCRIGLALCQTRARILYKCTHNSSMSILKNTSQV